MISNGTFNKIGNGTVQFSGSANNTFTGPTIVNQGNLFLNKSGGAVAVVGNLIVGDTLVR